MHSPTPPQSPSSVPTAQDLETDVGHEGHADVEQHGSSSPAVTPNGLAHPPGSDQAPDLDQSSPSPMPRSVPVTRTVAIIKNHALQYRFDIEPRIQEASFEIVKERQMEFDVETDPDALYELFGDDADSLAEGPVWVYVLERKRAVEVWNTLMGDTDPETARVEAPNSLRALYGISHEQNALMGSPDTQTAEIQIAALFASSPPFRTSDLPSEGDDMGRYGSMRSLSSSVLEALRGEAGYAASTGTGASTVNGSNKSNGKPTFKARAVPVTNIQPDIVPRMTRAAALRITGAVADTRSPNRPRAPVTPERHAETFANVPGHKRSSTIAVASTAPPVIAPRMTKAASLRIAKEAAAANGSPRFGSPKIGSPRTPPVKKRSVTDGAASAEKAKATFEGVPGHKRRETISVASVRPPTMAPRLNKSAALRASGGAPPPTSFKGSPAPTLSRTNSTDSTTSRRHSVLPPPRSSSTQTQSTTSAPKRRASSALDIRPPTNGSISHTGTTSRPPSVASRPRPSSVMSPPTIAPRTNKSAALRAAKMEAEAQAQAVAAAKKKTPRTSKPPPSSFKASTVST